MLDHVDQILFAEEFLEISRHDRNLLLDDFIDVTGRNCPVDTFLIPDRNCLVRLAGQQAGHDVSIVQHHGIHLVIMSNAGTREED